MKAWQECSRRLIETGELDPVYNLVVAGRNYISPTWAAQFCMAHLMFYSVKTSLHLARLNPVGWWQRVRDNYSAWTRGQERRHFRGLAGLASIASLELVGKPSDVFRSPMGYTFHDILKDVQKRYSGFGEYMGLKWVDLLDVEERREVDYSRLPFNLFSGAAKGLEDMWPGRPYKDSLDEIVDYIKEYDDPFQHYRKCGYSEAETIACAYRTYYVKRNYPFGWDINNIRETLKADGAPSSIMLLEHMPKLVEGWK